MTTERKKYPISALVASFNEAHLLEDCLKSLQFCDEIYYVDMNTSDNSKEIASKYATTIEIEMEDKVYIDAYFPEYVPKLRNDWFILIDPDERIRPSLARDVQKIVENPPPFMSIVRVPIWYFFKGEKLKGGPYRKPVSGRLLFYRPGVKLTGLAHYGIMTKPGFGLMEIPFDGDNYDEHYWCDSWEQYRIKHDKYAAGDGEVMYKMGKTFSWFKTLRKVMVVFLGSFIAQKFYRDGFRGLHFSYLEARYALLQQFSLRRYIRKMKDSNQFQKPEFLIKKLMEQKLKEFTDTTIEIAHTYNENSDEDFRKNLLNNYKRSLKVLLDEFLEVNLFDLSKELLNKASFNSDMAEYISGNLLLGRLKLIQLSGSYSIARRISNFMRIAKKS